MRPVPGDRAGQGPPEHDIRLPTGSPGWHTMIVPHHPRSAAMVRRELGASLRSAASRFSRDFLHDAAAVATELVGNAVRHALPLPGGVIQVDWQAYPDGVEIRVTDGGSPHTPVMRRPAPDAVSGRGLSIVAALAARWGVTSADRSRCVWAWLGSASQVAS